MKKRIAFLLIVPLLCVLAASLNISYMPAGGLLFISTCTLDGESFTIRQKTMPDGTKNRRVRRRNLHRIRQIPRFDVHHHRNSEACGWALAAEVH